MPSTVYIKSFGCHRRMVDASKFARYFSLNGFDILEGPENADYILLVTCGFKKSVLNEGFELIDELKRYDGELIVVGCIPGTASERLKKAFDGKSLPTKRHNEIDSFFPNFHVKFRDVDDGIVPYNGKASLSCEEEAIQERAFLRIANGCNSKCSYCAIPFATGPLRSKPINDVVSEYKQLLSKGARHVFFDGEDCGAYGLDIGSSFPELISALERVDRGMDVKWGFETMSPRWVVKYKDTLLDMVRRGRHTIIKSDIESGSPRILKLMNRYSNVERFYGILEELKRCNPAILQQSFFIVGFPTETDEDFQMTLDAIKRLDLDHVMLLPYSYMKGTKKFPASDLVPYEIKRERMNRAMKLLKKLGYKRIVHDHYLNYTK